MKRCCLVIVALFLMCGCHTSSDIVKEKNDIGADNIYEFSENELVALFSRFYLSGAGEEGVLLIFADGAVVAGMGEYGKILGDRFFYGKN